VVCTANDVTKLPPEFARAERFDAVFFVDLPSTVEKQAIWEIYRKHYAIDADQPCPADNDWTGAEIKACCRLSVLLNLKLAEAAKYVVPVAVTAAESIDQLRNWAAGRCLDATSGGIYRPGKQCDSAQRRRNLKAVGPRPSAN
jgi:SpoVK/Ycf46/Vps4 family AAA+-type ATPase